MQARQVPAMATLLNGHQLIDGRWGIWWWVEVGRESIGKLGTTSVEAAA